MAGFRRKASEQEIKGLGQKVKGMAQDVGGRITGNDDLRARGELNQIAGDIRGKAGEAGRRISGAMNRDRGRKRDRGR